MHVGGAVGARALEEGQRLAHVGRGGRLEAGLPDLHAVGEEHEVEAGVGAELGGEHLGQLGAVIG